MIDKVVCKHCGVDMEGHLLHIFYLHEEGCYKNPDKSEEKT